MPEVSRRLRDGGISLFTSATTSHLYILHLLHLLSFSQLYSIRFTSYQSSLFTVIVTVDFVCYDISTAFTNTLTSTLGPKTPSAFFCCDFLQS